MKKTSKLLHLSLKEQKIVESLRDQKLNIAQLARVTSISRATLYPHLEALLEKGVVRTSKKGKRVLYTARADAEVEESIIADILGSAKTISVPGEITYFTGLKQIQKLWLKIGTQPKQSRVITFQTNSALEYSLAKMSTEITKSNHENIVKNKIILEQYVEEGMHEFVKNILQREKVSNIFPVSDFTHRTTSTIVIKQGLFTEPIELFILFDAVLIIDWKFEKGYEIKNPHVVSMYKKLFAMIKPLGKLIDNAEVTREVFK